MVDRQMALTTTGLRRSRQPILECNPFLEPPVAHLNVFDLRLAPVILNDEARREIVIVEDYRRQQQRGSLSKGGSR
jgi:hypothetical protein